jgi:hypothetical protein
MMMIIPLLMDGMGRGVGRGGKRLMRGFPPRASDAGVLP